MKRLLRPPQGKQIRSDVAEPMRSHQNLVVVSGLIKRWSRFCRDRLEFQYSRHEERKSDNSEDIIGLMFRNTFSG